MCVLSHKTEDIQERRLPVGFQQRAVMKSCFFFFQTYQSKTNFPLFQIDNFALKFRHSNYNMFVDPCDV